ncbi:hypothetical protein [Neobacillus cucumis]|uniref:Uncharacterized protein n=1 Tax=Neobacillus cucumis TaxID=1740721 RepID=A0A2N5H934_9BACI|nr:hypothetical protein [Neobacillus cucumis]PLS02020.1 hypothetical protein CVD27_22255 [Neobacillus cucumis]
MAITFCLFLALLNDIVVFYTLLIGEEGARLLREYGAGETPQALMRRGGSPARPRKASAWIRKSTAKFNSAFFIGQLQF